MIIQFKVSGVHPVDCDTVHAIAYMTVIDNVNKHIQMKLHLHSTEILTLACSCPSTQTGECTVLKDIFLYIIYVYIVLILSC